MRIGKSIYFVVGPVQCEWGRGIWGVDSGLMCTTVIFRPDTNTSRGLWRTFWAGRQTRSLRLGTGVE